MAMSQKEKINFRKQDLIKISRDFCIEHLDQEYAHLCEKMIEKLSRKRSVPFMSGRINIWAASVVWAVGRINFLGDKSFSPHMRQDELAKHFQTSPSTIGQKAKSICDMLKLNYYDSEFSTKYMLKNNPFAKVLVSQDGFIFLREEL